MNDNDDIVDFDEDAELPEDLAQLLTPFSAEAKYSTAQQLEQLRRAVKVIAVRQTVIAKHVNGQRLIERDRKLYGKIVIGAGAFIMVLMGWAVSFFSGWWPKK